MRSILAILIFFQAALFISLVLSRKPNKQMGFEQSKNQEIDKFLLAIIVSFVFSIFSLKCTF